MGIKQYLKVEKRFRKIWLMAIIFIAILAILDIQTMHFWNLEITQDYAVVFWTFVFLAVLLSCITYYFIKKDKSESVAVGVIFYSLIWTGWEDIWFYLIKDQSIPSSMVHLLQHPVIGFIPRYLGAETVTPFYLILIAIIGVVVGLLSSNYLIKKL